MKQLIVMFSTILLGLAIFQMIAGSGDESIYSVVKQIWIDEVARF